MIVSPPVAQDRGTRFFRHAGKLSSPAPGFRHPTKSTSAGALVQPQRGEDSMSTVRALGAVLSLIALAGGTAWAQQYPSKPVRVVVVFPAGGGTDIVSRIIFQKVGEQMDQQFLIDNRGGASGMIGGAIVAKSPPDGYTLMVYSQ